MTTRNLVSVIAVLSLTLFVSSASASMMYYNGVGLNEIVTTHASGLLANNLTVYAGQERLSFEGKDYLGYCVDLTHYAATAQATPVSALTYPRGLQLAYLFDTYAPTVTTGRQAAALGVAIWELVTETGNTLDATSGYFYITGNANVAADANALLASIPANIHLDNVPMILYSRCAQSFIVGMTTVPEPAAVSMIGLGGAILFRRRK